MNVQMNAKVAVSYVLTVEGEVVDRADSGNPIEFIFGHGSLLPYFEEQLSGLSAGDTFKFSIPPDQGYGVYNEQNVIELPKDLFIFNGKLQEDLLVLGQTVPLQTATGQVMEGRVKEIRDSSVMMDMNHMLAGKTLNFEGSIENVRPATDEELEQLHSCGCCCDSCDDHGAGHDNHGCCCG